MGDHWNKSPLRLLGRLNFRNVVWFLTSFVTYKSKGLNKSDAARSKNIITVLTNNSQKFLTVIIESNRTLGIKQQAHCNSTSSSTKTDSVICPRSDFDWKHALIIWNEKKYIFFQRKVFFFLAWKRWINFLTAATSSHARARLPQGRGSRGAMWWLRSPNRTSEGFLLHYLLN